MESFADVIGQIKRMAPFQLGPLQRSAQYNLIQMLMGQVEDKLQVNEKIIDYLPLDVDQNSRSWNTGVLGLVNVHQPLARLYAELFHDTRGNRLLIFTNQRIIFLVPIDFLEEGQFFSYYFADIQEFTLRANKQDFLDRSRKQAESYLLDFQGGNHIFSELISTNQKAELLRILQKIDGVAQIPIGKKVVRKNRFDQIVNNGDLWLMLGKVFNVACFILVALLILGTIWGIGPLGYLQVSFF